MSKLCRSNPRFVGDPVDVFSGANTDSPVDLEQRGPILFQWARHYSSALSTSPFTLGWGHVHDFDRVLYRDLEGLRYEDPLRAVVGFPDLAVGEEAGSGGTLLTRTGEHLYVVSRPGQPSEEFEFNRPEDARLARLRKGDHTIEFHWDDGGTLRTIVDSRGRLIRIASDQVGRVVQLAVLETETRIVTQILLTYEYDEAGNLVRATDLYNTTLTFAYDAANRMIRRTDRRGYSFHFEYDDQGRCIHSRGDDGVLEVSLEYQPRLKTTIVRRGDGGRWLYQYDAAGVVTRITDPDGGVTSFKIDERERVTEEIDPNGNVTRLIYDDLGGHYARVDPLGYEFPPREEEPEPEDPLSYELPASPLEWEFGNLLDSEEIRQPSWDDPLLSGFPARVANAAVADNPTRPPVLSFFEDGESGVSEVNLERVRRMLEEPGPNSQQRWDFDVNGLLSKYRDRDGSTYGFTYTSWNLPYQEIDPLGNTTTFVHGPNLELATATDPGGTRHEFVYDRKDRLTEIHYDGRLLEQFRYDRGDNLIEKRNGKGRMLVSWEIGAGNVDKVRRLSNGEVHRFQHDESGRIVEATSVEGTVLRTYDEDGCLTTDQRDGCGIEHEFNLSQLSLTNYFGKFLVSYSFDENGDHIITDPTGGVHRTRISDNGLLLRQLANGTRELSQFDTEGRCRLKASLGGRLSLSSYTYSPEGDLLIVADSRRGITKYEYDAAHRLAKEHLPGETRAYAYDGAGNLLAQPGLERVEMAGGNRIRSANGDAFSYNDRENVVDRTGPSGSMRFEYDSLDRLVRCELDGEIWAAAYDALDRRVTKMWRGQTTTYYWDDFRLAAECRSNGSLRLYIYEDSVAVTPFLFIEYENRDADPESGKRFYIFDNQVGAPIRVEDDRGGVCWSARIDPYGGAEINPESTVEMPLRFPGHYHDTETDLHYNRFRYYSPELGRYLQPDPLGIEGGVNLFAYVDNPLIEVDIDGLKKLCPPKKPPSKKPPKKKSSKKPPPKKPKKRGKTSSNARKLRRNMGKRITKKQEAHHIVPSTHPKGAPGRGVLKRVGIGINDDPNGAPLAKGKHHGKGLHSHEKIGQVNTELKAAEAAGRTKKEKKENVEDALRDIEARQQAGKF